MRVFMWSYTNTSEGGIALRDALGLSFLRHKDSNYVPRKDGKDILLRWGGNKCQWDDSPLVTWINTREKVSKVINKKTFFETYSNTGCLPEHTLDKSVAIKWIKEGTLVVARTILNGFDGAGVVVASKEEELPDAELYVEYIPKDGEYRVHIIDGEIVDIQKKVAPRGAEIKSWYVRSFTNGFLYTRKGVEDTPNSVREIALRILRATGLDFGSVDVVYRRGIDGSAPVTYALEVNSAPALEGTILGIYAEKIKALIEKKGRLLNGS